MNSPNVRDLSDADIAALTGGDQEAADYNRKKRIIDQYNLDNKFDEIQERTSQLNALQKFNLDKEDPSVIQKIADENEQYLIAAKNAGVFINNDFKGKVPLFPKNVVVVAAETGVGKSTIAANLAYHAIMQRQRVLIIVNEESPGDVYNRVTCLIKGWAYVDHGSFTDEQRKTFKEMTILLRERIVVIDDSYLPGVPHLTTSIEGVETILNSTIENKNEFDLILIDYYQNIDKSVKVPTLSDHQAQYRFCKYIDQFKNRANAPIVVLAQLKTSGETKLSFKESIEGRKGLMNISTCSLKVTKDVENQRTGFTIEKSRFTAALGQTVWVGFDKGKYVDYTPEFKNKVQLDIVAKATQRAVSASNPSNFNNGE